MGFRSSTIHTNGKSFVGAGERGANQPRSIVLFDTEEKLRDLYQERLGEEGANSGQIVLVRPGEYFQDLGGQSYKINPKDREDFSKLFECLIEKQCAVDNICFAWPLGHADIGDEKCVKESLEKGVFSFLYVCQALIRQKLESKVQLLFSIRRMTSGASRNMSDGGLRQLTASGTS